MTPESNRRQSAIIIGAGPAGLTAAYELLKRTDIIPVVLEQSGEIGGISRTACYKGNRIDIGGHRFFSKSGRVNRWWQEMLPLQGPTPDTHGLPTDPEGPDPKQVDSVMLVRKRLSRIFYLGGFLSYPLELSFDLIRHLGAFRSARMALSYAAAKISPAPERSLADFLRNRFGDFLYRSFFKDYTEKLWGVPCEDIKPEWGAQRIKGLSLRKALSHAISRNSRKKVETSLIGHFFYPKFGPGQMWETVVGKVEQAGGRVVLNCRITRVEFSGSRVSRIEGIDTDGNPVVFEMPEWVFSTMPVRELLSDQEAGVPKEVAAVGSGLLYRDFLTVGLLCKRLSENCGIGEDNWLYIQDPRVKLGRVQIFNNWSPYMVRDPDMVWLGLEYFASEGGELWNMPDSAIAELARSEAAAVGLVEIEDISDHVVLRQPKAYPAYFGTYDHFSVIRDFVDSVENLFLIGRNGMHRYNNQDHSMLSAMTAVDILLNPARHKSEIWQVNADDSYHEGHRTETT